MEAPAEAGAPVQSYRCGTMRFATPNSLAAVPFAMKNQASQDRSIKRFASQQRSRSHRSAVIALFLFHNVVADALQHGAGAAIDETLLYDLAHDLEFVIDVV